MVDFHPGRPLLEPELLTFSYMSLKQPHAPDFWRVLNKANRKHQEPEEGH